jgi:phosphatidylglycerophosphate synthase
MTRGLKDYEMASRAPHLVIDARPRGPRGLLAAEVVLGRTMLSHLLELAAGLPGGVEPIPIHMDPEDRRELLQLVGDRSRARVVFVAGPPRADDAVLRTDRFYDAAQLRHRWHRGGSPESAVLWRLDRTESLLAADEELTHRLTYQPIGRYWAFPLARRLAESLRPTRVRPNAVTLLAAALMVAAAGLTAAGPDGWAGRAAVATAMALALVLDTTDGRLARLQGTSSAFGRWLDQFLDEMTDLALHAAIAWSAFLRDSQPLWLLVGIVYASGKYLFLVQSTLGQELEGPGGGPSPAGWPALAVGHGRGPRGLVGALRLAGHADIRWHLWIVLALLGRLDVALAAYAAYFPARTLAGAIRKGVRYA